MAVSSEPAHAFHFFLWDQAFVLPALSESGHRVIFGSLPHPTIFLASVSAYPRSIETVHRPRRHRLVRTAFPASQQKGTSQRLPRFREGHGIFPTIVPSPAVAKIVRREVLGLPDVAAFTLENQRAGSPLALAASAFVSSGMPRKSKNPSLERSGADSADHLPSFKARNAVASGPVFRSMVAACPLAESPWGLWDHLSQSSRNHRDRFHKGQAARPSFSIRNLKRSVSVTAQQYFHSASQRSGQTYQRDHPQANRL